jgi:hypothetical protein
VTHRQFFLEAAHANAEATIPHVAHGATSALEILDRALERIMDHRHSSRALKDLIRSACVERANLRIIAMIDPKNLRARSSGGEAASQQLDPRLLQADASLVLFFSRRPPPDYFFILGASVYFRNTHAESASLLSTALHCAPQRRWVYETPLPPSLICVVVTDILLRQPAAIPVARHLLMMSRASKPALQGLWERLDGTNGTFLYRTVGLYVYALFSRSATHTCCAKTLINIIFRPDHKPCRRMEAAYCSNGRHLFVFGGVRPCVSEAAYARTFSHAISTWSCSENPDIEPLGDLWMLDLATSEWTLLSDHSTPGYAGPSPRSFSALAFEPSSNTLLLYSGLKFSVPSNKLSSNCFTDLWRFDCSSLVWNRLPGKHPSCVKAGPSVIHDGGLFVVDSHCQSTSESTEIIRYDIASGCWRQQWCGGRGPVLESPVTGWAQDGRMYVFGIDRGSMSETAALWRVNLNEPAAGWQKINAAGGSGLRFKGPASAFWSEGAASFNPVNRKAYVFGGWNEHFSWFTFAADSGRGYALTGRSLLPRP